MIVTEPAFLEQVLEARERVATLEHVVVDGAVEPDDEALYAPAG